MKNPCSAASMPTGAFLQKIQGETKKGVHCFFGCVTPKERVMRERPSRMRFAEECVKLIHKQDSGRKLD